MSRETGPKCRICRRLQVKLYLKGSRCDTPKCAIEKRGRVPGQHGEKRIRLTDYGVHLRETQRAKRIYGLTDRQFKRYFQEANRQPGNTGEGLLTLLERRLDNVVYRLGFAFSRAQARQMIVHGLVRRNGQKARSPSQWVSAGDVIEPATRESARKLMTEIHKAPKGPDMPGWLEVDEEPLRGKVVQLPAVEEIAVPLDAQLIVEFASR